MKALMHVTLPPLGEYSAEAHFAPLAIMLEGMLLVNRHHISLARRMGKPVPKLFDTGVRYKEDPPGEENWGDLYYCMQLGVGDCLPLDTLVLRDDHELVTLGSLAPGDRIMGDGKWTLVQEVMATGPKPILAFRLSNGSTLRCSPEHKLFRDVGGVVEEIRASDARVGDDLLTPTSVPLAETDGIAWPSSLAQLSPADRSWLLGVFVADGWTDRRGNHVRSAISGLDGAPKEEQKRRVETMLSGVGIATRWHRKYLAINNLEVSAFFERCGHLAWNKRVPSLHMTSADEVRSVLDGLSADASFEKRPNKRPDPVYGTTSPTLALQLRVLYRMLGISASMRRVADHGGFGTHPIYRVIPRLHTKEGTAVRRDKTFARIRSISDGGTEECGDITTDTGRFWLPESDVLVHNCDRLIIWRCAELQEDGINAVPVIKWQHLTHEIAVSLGYPSAMVPPDGLWMVHCLVRFPDGTIEDTSKLLGMGGEYTDRDGAGRTGPSSAAQVAGGGLGARVHQGQISALATFSAFVKQGLPVPDRVRQLASEEAYRVGDPNLAHEVLRFSAPPRMV